ncbi:uncharacterized protein LOC134612222 [Pelobates fuscus]|uniref:uncharacterized protein LOC134612222 n=1 Tax=Pelobates fuscus TaxID=191477 RepID=UPI002FE44338
MELLFMLIIQLVINLQRGAEGVDKGTDIALRNQNNEEFVSKEIQTTTKDECKKSPKYLNCYLNITLEGNICYCSFEAGEDAKNATYFLHFCNHRINPTCRKFPVRSEMYVMIGEDSIHIMELISLWVEASENKQVYRSSNLTVKLDELVKLNPPQQKISCIRKDGYLKIMWERDGHLFINQEFCKEVQYKTMTHSDWKQLQYFMGKYLLPMDTSQFLALYNEELCNEEAHNISTSTAY